MNRKHIKGWQKHWDFIFLDLFCLQFSSLIAFWATKGFSNPYLSNSAYRYHSGIILACQFVTDMFTMNYRGILRRKKFDEMLSVIKFTAQVFLTYFALLFALHDSSASRLHTGFTIVFFAVLSFAFRELNKFRVLDNANRKKYRRPVVLMTGKDVVKETLDKLNQDGYYQDFYIYKVILLDVKDEPKEGISLEGVDIPICALNSDSVEVLSHEFVEEAFILQPENLPFPRKLMDELTTMGITVNYTLTALDNDLWPSADLRKFGQYKVLTRSIRFATVEQTMIKRIMDIIGGFLGCILTGVVLLFVGPLIYVKSPGPIIFTQNRIGKNGKIFKIHKIRSMYLDAEDRKASLMSQNECKDGLMFKMEDDPRIIGSEKKDKNGKPKGIGNFIRNTSLDEFPQFYDVLIGKMSLVGTRPPTIDEWNKYDLEHRARMSIKPGITGMWQVNGRSQIDDFEEVVRLDKEYIENWSILLDLKILLKTVLVVITEKGAK